MLTPVSNRQRRFRSLAAIYISLPLTLAALPGLWPMASTRLYASVESVCKGMAQAPNRQGRRLPAARRVSFSRRRSNEVLRAGLIDPNERCRHRFPVDQILKQDGPDHYSGTGPLGVAALAAPTTLTFEMACQSGAAFFRLGLQATTGALGLNRRRPSLPG